LKNKLLSIWICLQIWLWSLVFTIKTVFFYQSKQFVVNAYNFFLEDFHWAACDFFFSELCASVSLVVQGSRHRVNGNDILEAEPKNGNTVWKWKAQCYHLKNGFVYFFHVTVMANMYVGFELMVTNYIVIYEGRGYYFAFFIIMRCFFLIFDST
jgi:hypothetical protein